MSRLHNTDLFSSLRQETQDSSWMRRDKEQSQVRIQQVAQGNNIEAVGGEWWLFKVILVGFSVGTGCFFIWTLLELCFIIQADLFCLYVTSSN